MKMRSSAAGLLGLCLLSVVGGRSAATDESAAAASSSSLSSAAGSEGPRYGPLLEARAPLAAKRAYTYRSEYKRLPVYQFGLGKRWAQALEDKQRLQRFNFGLGKRTKQYSFGLGKRSSYEDGEASGNSYGYLPSDLIDAYAQRDVIENYLQGKRTTGFNFGLGKRESDVRDEALHEKLPIKHSRDKYLFGLGKRFYGVDDAEQQQQLDGDEDDDMAVAPEALSQLS